MNNNSILALEKLRNFFMSEIFMAVVCIMAALVTITKQEIYGAVIFVLIISFLLVICDDVIVTTLPFLLLSCFAAKCKNSFDIFIGFWWIVFIIVPALVFHFVYYRDKKAYSMGKSFWAIFMVSIAVTLGGIGKISPQEYFAGVSISNILGLGFGICLRTFWTVLLSRW